MKLTKRRGTVVLCRAGMIAACYAALTLALGGLSYGPLQIRPSEALCILPVFFPEAIPGLFAGCLIANLISGYGIYDVVFGSLITLIAACGTYALSLVVRKGVLAGLIGGIPPVIFNAVGVPIIIILTAPGEAWASYGIYFAQMLLTQCVWVYALGLPLYFGIGRMRLAGNKYLL